MSKVKAITLAPQALDRNGTSTTETLLATRLDLLFNGAGATGYDPDGIAVAQTNGASAALALEGALMGTSDLVTRKGVYLSILSGGSDNTGITFSVVGEGSIGQTITETITGPDANLTVLGATRFWAIESITSSAAITGNCSVGVNGYIDFATDGTPQHMALYSAGDDSGGLTWAVTGENRYKDTLSETITGVNAGTAVGALNFGRVDRVTASTGTAGACEGGWDGLCETQWFVLNYRGSDFNVGLGVDVVSGSLTYAVQHTWQNVLAQDYTEGDETVFTHGTLTGKTADDDDDYTTLPVAIRLAFTSFTSGSAILHVTQAGA
jgi:hypothetical protein